MPLHAEAMMWLGVPVVDLDGEDVRVVDDAGLRDVPALPAVGRLVGQVPRARVDDVGVARVDGEGLDVDEAGRGRGVELLPVVARVRRAPDAAVRAGEEEVGVLRGLRERVDAVALQLLRLTPTAAAVGRLEEAAGLLVAVRGRVDDLRVARVDDDVVDEEPGAVEAFEARPVVARVGRGVNLAVDGAEVEPPRVLRVDDERADVAAQGARRLPTEEPLGVGVGVVVCGARREPRGARRDDERQEDERGGDLSEQAILHFLHHGLQILRATAAGGY
jgi:hypothetical protein